MHAASDFRALRRVVSGGLWRIMSFAVAPTRPDQDRIGQPIIRAAFEHLEFNAADTAIVAPLFQIYQGSFIVMCLANISGRALYALRMIRSVAILSVVETVLYLGYTAAFACWWVLLGLSVASYHAGPFRVVRLADRPDPEEMPEWANSARRTVLPHARRSYPSWVVCGQSSARSPIRGPTSLADSSVWPCMP